MEKERSFLQVLIRFTDKRFGKVIFGRMAFENCDLQEHDLRGSRLQGHHHIWEHDLQDKNLDVLEVRSIDMNAGQQGRSCAAVTDTFVKDCDGIDQQD